MDAEKAFWKYWEKRWPFASSNEKVLSLSANFRETKAAFLAGWEKGKAQQLHVALPLPLSLESANENKEVI